jgi:hypothetical protein
MVLMKTVKLYTSTHVSTAKKQPATMTHDFNTETSGLSFEGPVPKPALQFILPRPVSYDTTSDLTTSDLRGLDQDTHAWISTGCSDCCKSCNCPDDTIWLGFPDAETWWEVKGFHRTMGYTQ